jgi:hypothetical protein
MTDKNEKSQRDNVVFPNFGRSNKRHSETCSKDYQNRYLKLKQICEADLPIEIRDYIKLSLPLFPLTPALQYTEEQEIWIVCFSLERQGCLKLQKPTAGKPGKLIGSPSFLRDIRKAQSKSSKT